MKSNNPYIILPFNFMRLRNRFLLVNLAGEYLFLLADDFNKMTSYSLNRDSAIYKILKAKHFITETLNDPAVELLSIKYRTKKDFLSHFTSLHMFVVTLRCNQKCIYCHASSKDINTTDYDMDTETAKKAVDLALSSPSPTIKIEFQGGEPLLNFNILKYIIEYATAQAVLKNKKLELVVCTNLTKITDEMLQYFASNNVLISTSLDGPKHVHDFNRRYRNGMSSYDDVIKGIERAKKFIKPENISALLTVTRYSLNYPQAIVDEYITNGFRSIFVRALNPFGYASQKMNSIGYRPFEFIDFYKRILEYIVDCNLKGTYIEESFTSLLLTKILTPFPTGFVDLQFPAGAGISCVIYDYNGYVYASDEGRMLAQMGDNSFCIGHVNNTYNEIFNSDTLRNIISCTCVESLPACSDCAFQIYCGIDPVYNYKAQNDIMGHRPTSNFCLIHKEIIKHLFEIIFENDPKYMDVFWSWLTCRNISEIRTTIN